MVEHYPIAYYRNKGTNIIYKSIEINVTKSNTNCHKIYHLINELLKDSNVKLQGVAPIQEYDCPYQVKVDGKTEIINYCTNTFLASDNSFLVEPPSIIENDYIKMTIDEVERWNKVIYIKQCRQEIDNIIQKVREISNSNSVEYSLKALTEGCMWLGMELKRLNQPDPYPSSKDPSTGDTIEQTADNLKL